MSLQWAIFGVPRIWRLAEGGALKRHEYHAPAAARSRVDCLLLELKCVQEILPGANREE
jgi:hypothetical protein